MAEPKTKEPKTKETGESVEAFLNAIADDQRRRDCFTVMELMKDATKVEPKMWGTSIVGFGRYHYIYASGREGDSCWIGFSPRKQNLTLYLMGGFEQHADLMAKLGKYSLGKGCLYINRLQDIDTAILGELIERSVAYVIKTHPSR